MIDNMGTSLVDELAEALQAMLGWCRTFSAHSSIPPALAQQVESALSAYYAYQSGEEAVLIDSPVETERRV